jgi:hypothetical protein
MTKAPSCLQEGAFLYKGREKDIFFGGRYMGLCLKIKTGGGYLTMRT